MLSSMSHCESSNQLKTIMKSLSHYSKSVPGIKTKKFNALTHIVKFVKINNFVANVALL